MTTKVCTKCGVEKDAGEFGRHAMGKLGLRASCKDCKRLAEQVYRNSPNGRVNTIEKLKRWRYRHQDHQKDYVKRRYDEKSKSESFKDEQRASYSAWRIRNTNELSDRYCAAQIAKRTSLSATSIPQPLINLKREQLRLMRELKKAKS